MRSPPPPTPDPDLQCAPASPQLQQLQHPRQPPAAPVQLLPLAAVRATIGELLLFSRPHHPHEHDHPPPEGGGGSLEERLYVHAAVALGGVRPLVVHRVSCVLRSAAAYAPFDADCALFVAVLRNAVDEGHAGLHAQLRASAAGLRAVFASEAAGAGPGSGHSGGVPRAATPRSPLRAALRARPRACLLPLLPPVVGPHAAPPSPRGDTGDGDDDADGAAIDAPEWGFIVRFLFPDPATAAAVGRAVWLAASRATVAAAFALDAASEAALLCGATASTGEGAGDDGVAVGYDGDGDHSFDATVGVGGGGGVGGRRETGGVVASSPTPAAGVRGGGGRLTPAEQLALAEARDAHAGRLAASMLATAAGQQLRQAGGGSDLAHDDSAGDCESPATADLARDDSAASELHAFMAAANPSVRLPWGLFVDALLRTQLEARERFLARFAARFRALDARASGFVDGAGFAQLAAAACPQLAPSDVAVRLRAGVAACGGSGGSGGGGRISFSECVRQLLASGPTGGPPPRAGGGRDGAGVTTTGATPAAAPPAGRPAALAPHAAATTAAASRRVGGAPAVRSRTARVRGGPGL